MEVAMSRKKKALTLDNLKIQKTETQRTKRGRKAYYVGKTFGLGLTKFVAKLFALNEQASRMRKMTDGEICRQICNEYREYKQVVDCYRKDNPKALTKIAWYRSQYNRGVLERATPPPKRLEVSFQYDMNGNKINPRKKSGEEIMGEQEVNDVRDRYFEYRKNWERARGNIVQ
jgi:hypothetical protein